MLIKNGVNYILLTSLMIQSCFQSSSRIRPEGKLSDNGFYKLHFNTIDGQYFDFSQLKGKNVVILNTASSCGYTNQYKEWEDFYRNNEEEWVVLAFPCNQFLLQERGDNVLIAGFCKKNFGVSFPLFEKSNVKGKNQNPVYRWLTHPENNGWNKQAPSWNFCKYIIDKEGELVAFLPSKITPNDSNFQRIAASISAVNK